MRDGGHTYTDQDAIENTNYSFLAPSMISLPNRSLSLIAASKTGKDPYNDYDYFSSVEGTMLAYSAGTFTGSKSSVDSAGEYSSTMGAYFANLNATIMPVEDWEPVPQTDHILSQLTPPSRADGTFLPLPDPEVIDPVVEIHSEKKIEPLDDKRTNPNSLYRTIAESLVVTGGSKLGVSAPPFKTTNSYGSRKIVIFNDYKDNNSSTSGIEVEVDTRETYNLKNTSNAVTWMAQDPEVVGSVLMSNGKHDEAANIENALMTLPNQIKSLFLSSSNPGVVTKKWFSFNYDFVRDLRGSAAFRLNYQLIKRVDVLVGYKRSNGRRMIKEPIWKPLTQAHYQDSIGEGLLCRLHTYVNPKMGITPPEGLEMPVYDEYFIVRPPRQLPNFGAIFDAASSGILSGALATDAADSFDIGFEGSISSYENSVDVAPIEATNSNFYDCGEVA